MRSRTGGVESHVYMLSQRLLARGWSVVVISHLYPPPASASASKHSHPRDQAPRAGVRWLSGGLRVYYIPLQPIPPVSAHATLPQYFACLPLIRNILLRERPQIVHTQGALTSLGLEALMHQASKQSSKEEVGDEGIRIRTVFTDHSLFAFGAVGAMFGNKVLQGVLADTDACIAVSHTGKENLVLRAGLKPENVSVIPNALVSDQFRPHERCEEIHYRTIVLLSRLVYRKGIDLLISAIPKLCTLDPKIKFLIEDVFICLLLEVAGEGPKTIELEQMREKYQSVLDGRVQLVGALRHSDVRETLIKGQIYLQTSLTEAFGIGILEAASCGLYVVATRVGGVPEVLPDDGTMATWCEVDVDDVVRCVVQAVRRVREGKHVPWKSHERVRGMYDWDEVARRTEKVYEDAWAMDDVEVEERLRRYHACGVYFGKVLCIILIVQWWCFLLLDWWNPREEIDLAGDLDVGKLAEKWMQKIVEEAATAAERKDDINTER
ncbi:glycosyltransferase family 4 protein [Atractiella rhizophila]|nr:glycosyltransferase family 4 protein [Atractiella rhizophila]